MSESHTNPKVFVSHITEEGDLANLLKEHVSEDFLDMIEVFVSSDDTSISLGSKWLDDVDEALKQAKMQLIVCSYESVRKPWVNFEAGAGWVRDIPIVPVCHTGMRPVDLPIPLNMLEGITANDPDGLRKMYRLLAEQLGSRTPESDFEKIAQQVGKFEHEYGLVRKVAKAVKPLIKLLPDLQRLFQPDPEETTASGRLPELTVEKMRPYLDDLQERGMLEYSVDTTSYAIIATSTFSGAQVPVNITVYETYYEIANQVMAYPS